MSHRRAILATLTTFATLTTLALTLPGPARGGVIYIDGNGTSCWCEGQSGPGWNVFPVYRIANATGECDLVSAAFRIAGVPDDPALMRRFDPLGGSTGDPFGAGIIVDGLVPAPGDTQLGYIWLFLAAPLGPQTWSIEAHEGMPGFTTPVAAFEDAPGTWLPETGYSTHFGGECDTCVALPAALCPIAVAPGTWSRIKRMYLE